MMVASSAVELVALWVGSKVASMVDSRAAWMVEYSVDMKAVDSVALWVGSKVASMVDSTVAQKVAKRAVVMVVSRVAWLVP